MHKMMMIAAACAVAVSITGCKSIEVERHRQSLATVQNADGTVSVVRDAANNPVVLDGGWEVDYFQHWNWQRFDSLSAKAGKDVKAAKAVKKNRRASSSTKSATVKSKRSSGSSSAGSSSPARVSVRRQRH